MKPTRSTITKLTPSKSSLLCVHNGCAWLIALALVAAMTLTAAEEVKLNSLKVGSKTYRHVTILGVSDTDLYFRHASGISNVKLRNLSPELQKQFGYDPVAAEEAERQQVQEDSAYLETVAVDVAMHAQEAAAAAKAAAKAESKKAASTEASLADPIAAQSLINEPAPKLEFGTWLAGKPETEGKAVLVFFWTTWSVPCRKAIAEMNNLRKSFSDRLVVIGWSAQEQTELAEFNEVKIDFPLAADPNGNLARAVGVTSVPQVLLVDAKGIVRYIGHPSALTASALKKLLTAAE
jgi:peroxiredoxin